MGLKKGLRYDFSVLYRQPVAGVRLHIQLLSAGGDVIGDTVLVPSGNHLPGIARHSLDATVDWVPFAGLHAGVEGRYLSGVLVNDVNSDYAPGYFVAALHAGWTKTIGAWTLSAFARVDDIADRKYIGSVIVNDGNGRYFEPAPGRTWFAGVSATAAF